MTGGSEEELQFVQVRHFEHFELFPAQVLVGLNFRAFLARDVTRAKIKTNSTISVRIRFFLKTEEILQADLRQRARTRET